MIVKTAEDVAGGKGDTTLSGGHARTLRYLLRDDGIGFTVSDIRVEAGGEKVLWYKNHIVIFNLCLIPYIYLYVWLS